jgi:hypothetical protein
VLEPVEADVEPEVGAASEEMELGSSSESESESEEDFDIYAITDHDIWPEDGRAQFHYRVNYVGLGKRHDEWFTEDRMREVQDAKTLRTLEEYKAKHGLTEEMLRAEVQLAAPVKEGNEPEAAPPAPAIVGLRYTRQQLRVCDRQGEWHVYARWTAPQKEQLLLGYWQQYTRRWLEANRAVPKTQLAGAVLRALQRGGVGLPVDGPTPGGDCYEERLEDPVETEGQLGQLESQVDQLIDELERDQEPTETVGPMMANPQHISTDESANV